MTTTIYSIPGYPTMSLTTDGAQMAVSTEEKIAYRRLPREDS